MLSKQARLASAIKIAKRYLSAKEFQPFSVSTQGASGLSEDEKRLFQVAMPYYDKLKNLAIANKDWDNINQVSGFLSHTKNTAENLHKIQQQSDMLQHVIGDFQKNRPTRKEVVKDPTFEKIEANLQTMNLLAMNLSQTIDEFIVVLASLHSFTEHGSASSLKSFCTDLKHIPHYMNEVLTVTGHLKDRVKPLAGLLSDEKAKLDALAIEDTSGVGGWFRKMFRMGSASIEAMFLQPIMTIEKMVHNTLPASFHGTIDDPASMTKACNQLTEIVMMFEGFKHLDSLITQHVSKDSSKTAQVLRSKWEFAMDVLHTQVEGLKGESTSYGVFFLNHWDAKQFLNFKATAYGFFSIAAYWLNK